MKIPEVEVAVVVIRQNERILAIWNPRWGCFTLPMTKRKILRDRDYGQEKAEPWEMTACRAAAEALGMALENSRLPVRTGSMSDFRQSDADGQVKSYFYEVFCMDLPNGIEATGQQVIQWLTRDELFRKKPISGTATEILKALKP